MNWCGYAWETAMDGGRKIHPSYPWFWYSEDCVCVEKGVLHLKIEHKPNTIKHWDGKTYHPTIAAGLIRSKNPFSYGTFSADIMLPKGKNLWPSFWTSGDKSWPPEIDIMEAWNGKNGNYFTMTIPQFPYLVPSWMDTTNVHYNEKDKNGALVKTDEGSRCIPLTKLAKNPSKNFVNYKCEWRPDSIRLYADGKLVRKFGEDIARSLTHNNSNPDFRMDVIFNVLCDDPSDGGVEMDSEMLVKNFTHTAL